MGSQCFGSHVNSVKEQTCPRAAHPQQTRGDRVGHVGFGSGCESALSSTSFNRHGDPGGRGPLLFLQMKTRKADGIKAGSGAGQASAGGRHHTVHVHSSGDPRDKGPCYLSISRTAPQPPSAVVDNYTRKGRLGTLLVKIEVLMCLPF